MFKSITKRLFPEPQTVEVEKIVYQKDPHGLMARDINLIKKYAGTGKYNVGDSLESVAYRQGQLDLISMIENKLMAKSSTFK